MQTSERNSPGEVVKTALYLFELKTISLNLSVALETRLRGTSINAFSLDFSRILWEKIQNKVVVFISDTEWKVFDLWVRLNRPSSKICIFCLQRIMLGQKNFEKKYKITHFFRLRGSFFSEFEKTFFSRVVKTEFIVSVFPKTFRWKQISK